MDIKLEERQVADVVIRLNEEQARSVLVDAAALQKEIRALLANHRAATDTRSNHLRVGRGPRKVHGPRSAKSGGGKKARRRGTHVRIASGHLGGRRI